MGRFKANDSEINSTCQINLHLEIRGVSRKMRTYYQGKHAALYNQTWQRFSEKTLTQAFSTIDFRQLEKETEERGHPLRILDVACGTGLLLQNLASRLPHAQLYGVDSSQDMLALARKRLCGKVPLRLEYFVVGPGGMAGFPFPAESFDLIICTNAFHYFQDPVAVLQGLASLLAPQGQFVIEDYARRGFPFPWTPFEWLIKRVDPQHMRAFTLGEAQHLCQQAGLQVTAAKSFPIDLLLRGWVIRVCKVKGDAMLK
jgi:ubiquinone/menaquinone biosynthesis C-methylase UbiE